MKRIATAVATLATAGMGTLAWAHYVELNRFTLRRAEVVLPGLPRELRVLHISDIHYVPGQRRKFQWLQSLADLRPDLVINTGDNLSDPDAIGEVLEALAPLREFPGAFVPGSNDYYAPHWKNPLAYFRRPSQLRPEATTLPTEDLFEGFEASGWANLTNTHTELQLNGMDVALSGTDDAHIGLERFTGWPTSPADLRLGVTHAPVSSILETFAASGADLVLAGHTHGGQVCLPGERALVTNCDLPVDQVKGISEIQTPTKNVPLHVSGGIGTSAKAQVRLFCPPEATLLRLTPRA